MIGPILLLCVFSFVLSWVLTWVVKRVAVRVGFVDKPGGRKIHANPKPLGGGIAIFWAIVLPMLAGLAAANFLQPPAGRYAELARYWSGIRQQTPLALGLLMATLALHIMGLLDDRKPLGPYVKLAVQL